MTYAAFILLLLYYGSFAIYYKILFPMQGKGVIPFVLTFVLIITAYYITLQSQNLSMLNLPVVMAIMIVGLRFMTSMNWLQAVYGGIVSVLSAYCVRGVFISLGALVFRPVLFGTTYCILAMIGLLVGLFLFLILRKTVFSDQKLKMFLYNESQLKLIISYGIGAALDLTIMYSGRYISQHDVWFPAIALANYALSFGVLIFAVYQSIRGAELLVYQERSQIMEQQYDRQVGHYKFYQKYTESFRAFQHDHKAMMGTVKSLIRAGEGEQAIQIIDTVYDDAQKRVRVHKQYSHHAVLDVMLQDLANLCNENEIQFSFQVSAPHNTRLTLFDGIRIFSNATNNAVEACKKLPASEERYIHITSITEQQWAVLEVTNSCNGEITLHNGKPVTTKADTENHGFGLGIVSEIAETLGGFVLYNIDAVDRTFSIRIFIPQVNS